MKKTSLETDKKIPCTINKPVARIFINRSTIPILLVLHSIICRDICSPLLLDFSLTAKAATLIFISGCGSAIPSAKEGKSGFIYNLAKS